MKNKILVLGRGYLGKEFERHNFEVWGRDRFNITSPLGALSSGKYKDLYDYDVIINCIGKSNTRWCEDRSNLEEALFVNGYIPKLLSNLCEENGIKFVHISTGCLYDNTEKANTEDDFVSAHCVYTATKLIGERFCSQENDLILRPRLYFSDIEDKNNLLCKLDKFDKFTGDKLDSMTSTSTIVGAVNALLEAEQSGIFNVSQSGSATIAKLAHWCGIKIKGITTAEQLRNQENLYLVNNVMDISKLTNFYIPADIETAIKLSYAELRK